LKHGFHSAASRNQKELNHPDGIGRFHGWGVDLGRNVAGKNGIGVMI
jgi:hypothetical protein